MFLQLIKHLHHLFLIVFFLIAVLKKKYCVVFQSSSKNSCATACELCDPFSAANRFYIALFSALECSHVILYEWLAFYSAFSIIHRRDVFTALAWLVPHETAAVSARSVYTLQPCTISFHESQVHACLAVTCHLHFWQNDQDLLCATAVARGWHG